MVEKVEKLKNDILNITLKHDRLTFNDLSYDISF